MNIAIYKCLSKWYINFKPSDWKPMLKLSDAEVPGYFNKIWKREHGGLYNLTLPFNPPEILPYKVGNRIVVTETGSNSKSFYRTYIKTLNQLLLNESGIINLDFRNNGGGKPHVMMAGLLPIFNNYNVQNLAVYYMGNARHFDIVRNHNRITSKVNDSSISGTARKTHVEKIRVYFNARTASAAEQAIICLLSLRKYIEIELVGSPKSTHTAGYTTVNKYFPISPVYGLEIPIGVMGTMASPIAIKKGG